MKALQDYIQESIEDRLNESILDSDEEAAKRVERSTSPITTIDMVLDVLKRLVKSKKLTFIDTILDKNYKNEPYICYKFRDEASAEVYDELLSLKFAQKINRKIVGKYSNYIGLRTVAEVNHLFQTNILNVTICKGSLYLNIEQYMKSDELKIYLTMIDEDRDKGIIDYFKKKIDKIIKSQKR